MRPDARAEDIRAYEELAADPVELGDGPGPTTSVCIVARTGALR